MIIRMMTYKITSYNGGIIRIKPYGENGYQGTAEDIEGIIVDGHPYEFIQKQGGTSEKSLLLSIISKNEKEYKGDNDCELLEEIIKVGGLQNYLSGKREYSPRCYKQLLIESINILFGDDDYQDRLMKIERFKNREEVKELIISAREG